MTEPRGVSDPGEVESYGRWTQTVVGGDGSDLAGFNVSERLLAFIRHQPAQTFVILPQLGVCLLPL